MAQIIVRNLDESIKIQLTMNAKLNGRSMEEEVRQILSRSILKDAGGLGTTIAHYFEDIGFDEDITEIENQEMRNPFGNEE